MKWNFHHKNVAFHPIETTSWNSTTTIPPSRSPFMQRKATVRDFTKPVTEILSRVADSVGGENGWNEGIDRHFGQWNWILGGKKKGKGKGNKYEIYIYMHFKYSKWDDFHTSRNFIYFSSAYVLPTALQCALICLRTPMLTTWFSIFPMRPALGSSVGSAFVLSLHALPTRIWAGTVTWVIRAEKTGW